MVVLEVVVLEVEEAEEAGVEAVVVAVVEAAAGEVAVTSRCGGRGFSIATRTVLTR